MSEAWEPSKKECLFGYQVTLGRKILSLFIRLQRAKLCIVYSSGVDKRSVAPAMRQSPITL